MIEKPGLEHRAFFISDQYSYLFHPKKSRRLRSQERLCYHLFRNHIPPFLNLIALHWRAFFSKERMLFPFCRQVF